MNTDTDSYGAHKAVAKSTFDCTWCGEKIFEGEDYLWFTNYVEDRGFCGRNFHHPECQQAIRGFANLMLNAGVWKCNDRPRKEATRPN